MLAQSASRDEQCDACILATPPRGVPQVQTVIEAASATEAPEFSVYSSAASLRHTHFPWFPMSTCVMQAIDKLACSELELRRSRSIDTLDSAQSLEFAVASSSIGASTSMRTIDGCLAEYVGEKRRRLHAVAEVKSTIPAGNVVGTGVTVAAVTADSKAAGGVFGDSSTAELAEKWRLSSSEALITSPASSSYCPAWAALSPRPRVVGAAGASTVNPLSLLDVPSLRYLATGMDAFLTREPDLVEAMALVHSRVRRVIYCSTNPLRGALESSPRPLHEIRSLNHHYEVYRVDQGVTSSTDSAPAVIAQEILAESSCRE